jgi:predicted secreted protein
MAEQKGIDGIVKIDAKNGTPAAVLNVTAFTLEETTETIDVTSMGDGNRVILPTFTGFSGSVDGYWDTADAKLNHTDSVEPVIRAGITIDFEFWPEGNDNSAETGGDRLYYEGSAIVTSVSRSSSFDGAVEYSIAFDGTGDLTYAKLDGL